MEVSLRGRHKKTGLFPDHPACIPRGGRSGNGLTGTCASEGRTEGTDGRKEGKGALKKFQFLAAASSSSSPLSLFLVVGKSIARCPLVGESMIRAVREEASFSSSEMRRNFSVVSPPVPVSLFVVSFSPPRSPPASIDTLVPPSSSPVQLSHIS